MVHQVFTFADPSSCLPTDAVLLVADAWCVRCLDPAKPSPESPGSATLVLRWDWKEIVELSAEEGYHADEMDLLSVLVEGNKLFQFECENATNVMRAINAARCAPRRRPKRVSWASVGPWSCVGRGWVCHFRRLPRESRLKILDATFTNLDLQQDRTRNMHAVSSWKA